MPLKITPEVLNRYISILGHKDQKIKNVWWLEHNNYEDGNWAPKNDLLMVDVLTKDGDVTFINDIEKFTGMTILLNSKENY